MGLSEFLADMGASIERHVQDDVIALLLVAASLLFNVIGAFLVIVFIANMRRKAKGGVEVKREAVEYGLNLSTILGMMLVLAGGFWLIKEYVQVYIPFSVGVILVGALLILVGTKEASRGG